MSQDYFPYDFWVVFWFWLQKKNGLHHFCYSHHVLSAVTHLLLHPLLRIEDTLKIFQHLYARCGFQCILMWEHGKKKPAFTCHLGSFHFNCELWPQKCTTYISCSHGYNFARLDILVFTDHIRDLQSSVAWENIKWSWTSPDVTLCPKKQSMSDMLWVRMVFHETLRKWEPFLKHLILM